MRMSRHAQERWRERHPTLDPATEFASARRAGKRLRLLLAGRHQEGDPVRHYLLTTNGVVFIVSESGVVITVLRLAEAKRRARARNRVAKGIRL